MVKSAADVLLAFFERQDKISPRVFRERFFWFWRSVEHKPHSFFTHGYLAPLTERHAPDNFPRKPYRQTIAPFFYDSDHSK